MLWKKLLVFCAIVIWAKANDTIELSIPQGTLQGKIVETVFQKKQYYSFKGIPYAKPNVGVNKFNLPEPAEPWSGIYDATQHRSPCPFFCMIKQGMLGSEDCLFVNVYTTDLNKDAQKAVMVWFHGGAFNMGSGDDDFFGPDFLIEEDVILVTLNSRLGVIGYLNTGDDNAPGNVGLKDQVMALKWIKDNIQFFGGSPEKVTIFGHSSGASCVQYHMMSPMSQGLFSSAIMQSGSAVNSYAITYNPREMAFKLGEILGIKTTDSAELVKKLSEREPKDLVTATQELTKSENPGNGHIQPFVPSIEIDVGKEIFLPADPWELLKSGKLSDIPVMSGIAAQEAIMFLPLMLAHVDHFNAHLESFIPYDLNITDPAKQQELADTIRSFYFKDKMLSKDTSNEFQMLLSDVVFIAETMLSNRILTVRNSASIYEYLFTYDAPFGIMKNLFKVEKGVSHGDELGYIFYANWFKNLPAPKSTAEHIAHVLVKLWTNFAKTGNPTPFLDDYVKVMWEPRGREDNYMDININLKMEKGLYKDRIDFWAGIYKDVLGQYS